MNMAIRPVIQNARNSHNLKKRAPPYFNKTFNSNVRKEEVSFANVVSEVTSPPFPPLENKNATTNENISSNKEIHGIDLNENSSDLAQVIELVNLISEIIKRSPKILQLINKLKNAEDFNSKTCILVEALLDKE
ncbi:hypothetical protein TNCV_13611 [Trichonephila clavipes]|nr:hypothetical protein TNCV_13611 [Trichonephila clavipes]